MKINFKKFKKIMKYNINKNSSIEINFYIDNSVEFDNCWLGKQVIDNKITYWYGLKEDGSQSYSYYSLDDFLDSKVFNGKNIKEIWDNIILCSIDACEVEARLPFYLH